MQSSYSTNIIFATLAIVGFALLPFLSIQFLPNNQQQQLNIKYNWTNASPSIMEQVVTTPLEGAFSLIQGIEKIYSVNRKGIGYIELDIDKKADLDFVRFEISNKIRQVYPTFPKGVSYPRISVKGPDLEIKERPILTYSLSGPTANNDLYSYAIEALRPQLSLTQGIQEIEVQGGNPLEWRITYQDALCKQLGISKSNILEALQLAFQQDALGIVHQGNFTFSLQLQATSIHREEKENSILQFQQIPLTQINERIIRLGEVATIELLEQIPYFYYHINGQNSIRLLFFPEQQVNTIRLARTIKKQLQEITTTLPDGYQLSLDDDATEYLSAELDKIGQRTLFSLGILLLFVLLVYCKIRYLGVLLCSLIANLGISFIFYYWLGIELHLYALAGITVSFGIIIDNSLVIIHHWQRQRNLRIFPALLASTLTTFAALITIYFLPDQWKWNLVAFAQVIGINLGVSLVVAVWLIPALMSGFNLNLEIQKRRDLFRSRRIVFWLRRYKRILSFLLQWRKTVLLLVLLVFGLPVFLLPNNTQNWEWYNSTLGSTWYVEQVKPYVNKCLGGSLRLFVWYVYESASYRQPDETVLYIQGSMPNGTTVAQMNAVFKQVETYIAQYKTPIKQYVTNINSGQFGQTQVYFKEGHTTSFPYQLKNRLVDFSLNLGGVEWNIYGVGNGFSNANSGKPLSYRKAMYGYNKDALNKQAKRFAKKLEQHPRVKSVNTAANINWWTKDLYEYDLSLQREELARLNRPPVHLLALLENFDKRTSPSLYTHQQEAVRLVNQKNNVNELWTLQNQALLLDSTFLYFNDFGQLKKQKVVGAIHKENQQYIQVLEWEYSGSERFGTKHLERCQAEMEQELPLGYSIKNASYGFGLDTPTKPYYLLLLILGLIFFICAIQFESFRQAFAIILLIPISFIGIFLTFYLFDFNFDQGGYTSFILLSGLVVNGLILIINDFNYYRKKYPNRSFIDNYTKAFQQKITPVILTILSTALGLIPFLWHGQQEVFWFALAVGTIGGLLFSIIVLVGLIPLFLKR